MIATLWWLFDGMRRTGPWEHPVRLNAASTVRIDGSASRILAIAIQPRIELDGDTHIDPPNENQRIEADG